MDADEKKIINWIDDNSDEITRIAGNLIEIPSVSGKEDSNKYYEEEADYLISEFDKIGVEGQKISKDIDSGVNCLATMHGTESNYVLALGGHYDVVPANEKEWDTDGFKAVVKDGKLFGRGAADMKGGLAACVVAMKAIKECNIMHRGDIQLIASIDEEVGGNGGMDYLINSGTINPNCFINAEQTEMEIIVAYKGCAWMEVKTHGVAAHGSKPELGVNAIKNAADAIEMISGLSGNEIQFVHDDLLGDFSLNVGMIEGGSAINVVPDACSFKIDGRFVPGQDYNEIIKIIRKRFDEMHAENAEFKAEIEFISRCTNAVRIPEDSDLVKSLRASSKKVCVNEAPLNGFIAAGDNCLFHRKGTPALMYGPGSLDVIHKANEHCNIKDLISSAKIYALTALELCK